MKVRRSAHDQKFSPLLTPFPWEVFFHGGKQVTALTALGEYCFADLSDVRSLRVVFLGDGIPGGITITFKSLRRDIILRKRDSRLCWAVELTPLRERLAHVGKGLWLDLSGLIRVDKRKDGDSSHLELEFAPLRPGDAATTLSVDSEIGDSVWQALCNEILALPAA
ncbi:MAG: hypothetical protein WBW33_05510 [Bryobacteraceae bacterium]